MIGSRKLVTRMNDHTYSEFSITRRIEIDMAHRIPHHASKCYNLHGHRYVIEATCIGETINRGEQTGMVMDFGFLKQCMMDVIHDPYDHGMALYEDDHMVSTMLSLDGIKLRVLRVVPTAENLAMVWYNKLRQRIEEFFEMDPNADAPHLLHLDVWETPNCVARYPV